MNLKLTINQNAHIQETEITINCAAIDSRIRNLANYLRQYSASLEGKIDDSTYYVPLDSILYIDSVDRRTFFYDRHRIFSSRYTLSELEEKLENTQFIRISKCCMVNLAYVQRTCPYENHRLEVVMSNGEHLIAANPAGTALRLSCGNFTQIPFMLRLRLRRGRFLPIARSVRFTTRESCSASLQSQTGGGSFLRERGNSGGVGTG